MLNLVAVAVRLYGALPLEEAVSTSCSPNTPVAEPEPNTPVDEPEPNTPVDEPEPKTPVADPEPNTPVDDPEPKTPVDDPEPRMFGSDQSLVTSFQVDVVVKVALPRSSAKPTSRENTKFLLAPTWFSLTLLQSLKPLSVGVGDGVALAPLNAPSKLTSWVKVPGSMVPLQFQSMLPVVTVVTSPSARTTCAPSVIGVPSQWRGPTASILNFCAIALDHGAYHRGRYLIPLPIPLPSERLVSSNSPKATLE